LHQVQPIVGPYSIRRRRPSDQVSLHEVAARFPQPLELRFILHALGHDARTNAMRQRDDHLDQLLELRIEAYVPDTVLTLEVKQINSLFIYVLGRVNNPGRPQLTGNVNVLQALAMAGGLNPFARRSDIRILRQEGGKTRVIHFNYDEVTSGERMEDNIELKRGDVLFVP